MSVPATFRGRALVAGEASGLVLASAEPLSFWGGYDARTGEIIDRRHPLSGQMAAGRVLAVPFTRGSSTTAQVLLEAVRAGTAPAAGPAPPAPRARGRGRASGRGRSPA